MTGRPRLPHPDQLGLLDWEPSQPVRSFAPEKVRGASLAVSIAKSTSLTMKEYGASREIIARQMSDFLGEEVSKNMLDAWASESRSEHIINLVKTAALLHVTRDPRLLNVIVEPLGWVVIDKDYLDDIELAEVLEARDEINRRADAIRRRKRKSRARRAL